ncbi:MAG: pantoate--beta-alanine ligase [Dehalococcoidia bacterium]|nr:pantoate--beta-alanine ligase [Dehalococcoidia bacterium]
MQIAKTIPEMKALRKKLNGTVGFVPTMGYLHDGHLELVRYAKKENHFAVVSIFVNPTQFAPNEDFKAYPRDLNRDLAMLETVRTDIVFIPEADEMYPGGYDAWVDVKGITETLEGRFRPTHFRGVTTVCNKLFNIVESTKAYFGQKDAQQARVIQKMVADLNMNLEIVIIPTVREKDGLAMSSRNTYLTTEERSQAPILYKSLQLASDMHNKGERSAAVIIDAMTKLISSSPATKIDYISISDFETLRDVETLKGKVLISMAVKLGKPRLIDNILLG